MTVETAQYINQLDPKFPEGGDSLSEGDDHIRLIKEAITKSFPNVDGPVDLTTEEFGKLKSGLTNGGIVASCKYNGSSIMYQEGVSDVTEVGSGGYKVTFDTEIAEFDQHYAPLVTPFVSSTGRPVVCALTGFTATELEFTLTEFDGVGGSSPAINSGFSMIIVDMITN
jgi:hypothetical protein